MTRAELPSPSDPAALAAPGAVWDWIAGERAKLEAEGLLRERAARPGACGITIERHGRSLTSFASNDYLGLAADPRLAAAIRSALPAEGVGSGASPLVTGYGAAHQQLEAAIAAFEGTEAALIFGSGYAANLGTVAALVGPGDAVFGDRLNHASLIDGCRLSGAHFRTYRHLDLEDLEQKLAAAERFRRRLIVTDSLFSMDGDVAALADLVCLAERYQAMLLIDEAHATGVFGPSGRGLAEEQGVESAAVLLRIGTLSKALGAAGGFVAGSRAVIDWLVNRARTYIYSTAMPAVLAEASRAALSIVSTEPAPRRQLLALADQVRGALDEQGWNTGASRSQIIPIIVGDTARAQWLGRRLAEMGWWLPVIRPPTVPRGTARLRISLTAHHSEGIMESLIRDFATLRSEFLV